MDLNFGKSVGAKGIIQRRLRLAYNLQTPPNGQLSNYRNYEENNSGDGKAIGVLARADVELYRGKDKAVLKFKLSCAAFLRF
ncbi:MAG: hypothetical protein OHK0019_05710 [Saprospiraceae bacterium]